MGYCNGKIILILLGIFLPVSACEKPVSKRSQNTSAPKKVDIEEDPIDEVAENPDQSADMSSEDPIKSEASTSPAPPTPRESLEQICLGKGPGWVFGEGEQTCHRATVTKTPDEICKLKGNNWEYLEGRSVCADVLEKKPLKDICETTASTFLYQKELRKCLDIGERTTLSELCEQQAPIVRFDEELRVCTSYKGLFTAVSLCNEISGIIEQDDCKVGEEATSLLELCSVKGKDFQYDSVLNACFSVDRLTPANGLCLALGPASHVYDENTGDCIKTKSQEPAIEICEKLGDLWEFVSTNHECYKVKSSEDIFKTCQSSNPRCVFNPEKGIWDIVDEILSPDDLCKSINPELVAKNGQCEGKNGEIVLPNGTTLLPDGTKILPDGTKILANGIIILSDGTKIFLDGSRIFPDGSSIDANGIARGPDGQIIGKNESGETTFPDGSILRADGSILRPDGTVISANGQVDLPGDISIDAKRTISYPDGTKVKNNGDFVTKEGEIEDQARNRPTNPSGEPGLGGQIKYKIQINAGTYEGKHLWNWDHQHFASWLEHYDNYYSKDYSATPQIVKVQKIKCPAGYRIKFLDAEKTYLSPEKRLGEFINWISITCQSMDQLSPRQVTVRQGYNETGSTGTLSCTGAEIPTGIKYAVYEAFPKNLELECAPFIRSLIEIGDGRIDFNQHNRLFTGKGAFNNDALGERRFGFSCNDQFTKNRVLTGLKFAVDMTNAKDDYWVPLWFHPLCSEIVQRPLNSK